MPVVCMSVLILIRVLIIIMSVLMCMSGFTSHLPIVVFHRRHCNMPLGCEHEVTTTLIEVQQRMRISTFLHTTETLYTKAIQH